MRARDVSWTDVSRTFAGATLRCTVRPWIGRAPDGRTLRGVWRIQSDRPRSRVPEPHLRRDADTTTPLQRGRAWSGDQPLPQDSPRRLDRRAAGPVSLLGRQRERGACERDQGRGDAPAHRVLGRAFTGSCTWERRWHAAHGRVDAACWVVVRSQDPWLPGRHHAGRG